VPPAALTAEGSTVSPGRCRPGVGCDCPRAG
jgi:hypothetical protein